MSAPKVEFGAMEVWEDRATAYQTSFDPPLSALFWDVAALLVQCALQAAAFACFAYSFANIVKVVLE